MEKEKTHQLILQNDNENNYLYVMANLIAVCDHARDQAEQCAIITHNVGQCQIKIGNITDMIEMMNKLQDLGLKVKLEEYESNLHK